MATDTGGQRAESYRQRAREFYEEVLNNKRLERLEDFLAPDFLDPSGPQVTGGIEGYRSYISSFHRMFPNARVELEEVIVEGDRVVTCWRMTGGDSGSMFSFRPAEGGGAEVSGVNIMRIRNGKVQEMRSYADLTPLIGRFGFEPALNPGGSVPTSTTGT
jgi:steroid delta-isomerase-like uncharacterized protein